MPHDSHQSDPPVRDENASEDELDDENELEDLDADEVVEDAIEYFTAGDVVSPASDADVQPP